MFRSSRLALIGRFAIALLLLSALAPSIARGLAIERDGGPPFAVLCSTVGQVSLPGGEDTAMSPLDCPLCLPGVQPMLLPPAAYDAAALLSNFSEWRPPHAAQPRCLRVGCRLALARAPPLSC